MPTSRFGAPRGSLPRILAEAGDIADSRIRLTMKLLDEFTDATSTQGTNPMGGGGRLSGQDFRTLLQSNPPFRDQVARRWFFATSEERERLLKEIQRVFPQGRGPGGAATGLPNQVLGEVPGAIPPTEMGTGLGGPPQGAGPVGPVPQPGAAPLGAPPLPTPITPGPPGLPPTGEPLPPLPPGPIGPPAEPTMPPPVAPVGPSAPPQIPLTPTGGALPPRPALAARLV